MQYGNLFVHASWQLTPGYKKSNFSLLKIMQLHNCQLQICFIGSIVIKIEETNNSNDEGAHLITMH